MVPSEEMRRNNAGALKATFPCNLGLNDKTLASCARCGIPGMITEAYQDECKEGSTFALTPTSCASFNPEEGGGEALASEIDFITMDGYGFDYVMVFAAETPGMMTPIATKVIRKIIAAGLRVRVHFSNSEEEIFCEIRAPVERLMRFADQVDRKLLLDRDQLERAAEAGDPEATIAPLRINDDSSLSLLSPYEYIYARYDKSPKLQILYQRGEGMWHPFRSSLRLGLTMGILEATTRLGGAGLKPDRMRVDGQILALFPKHSIHEKGILGDKWLVLKRWPWNAPYDGIKDYFGERIGLYFHFLGHLTTWLIPLATMGLAAALVVYTTGDVEHPITLLLAFVAVLWAIAMMESWKRKEKRVALAWGTTNFEESEHTRPEYTGVMIHSPVDGSLITFYPPDKRAQRMRRATVIVVTMIAGVLSCIAAVYAFRWYMIHGAAGRWGRRWGEIITSLLNSVQIHILNMFYKTVAVALTGYENHRTVNEYEDSLVMKLFGFMFCNSYGSFFYLAFVGQPLMGIECERRCMDLLATNLTIVLGVQLVVGNTMQVLVPYVKYKLREHARRRTREPTGGRGGKDGGIGGLKTEHTQSEESYIMEAYDPVMGTLMDYAELAVQFGYVTLFVAAFPLAPAFALANDHVKARSHAFRMLKQMRRPAPRGARDIGSWRGVFTALTCVSVVTNSALVCFAYEDLIGALSLPTRLWLFVLFQWAGSLAMIAVRAMVPEVPSEVKLQLKRAAFLSKKMINKVSDKEDDTKRHLDEDLVMGAAAISPPASPTRMSPQASGRHIV